MRSRARPAPIPNGTGTQYPTFSNQGTTQPKFDARVDYDAPDGNYKLVFAGGYSGTDGIFHTGIGPFDADRRRRRLRHDALHARRAEVQLLHQHPERRRAAACWRSAPTASRSSFKFNTQTYDFELGNINTIGTRNVLSYGGNVRFNTFDLSIAPRGDSRTELGGYVQDEIFLNDYVRAEPRRAHRQVRQHRRPGVLAARRADPQAARRPRASACRTTRRSASPSLINNYLETTIVNQLNLGADQPGAGRRDLQLPGARDRQRGPDRGVDASRSRSAYTGIINNRATVSAAVYCTTNTDEIFFTQTGRYRAAAPPPGWPLPAGGARSAAAAVRAGRPCTTGGLPSEFSYRNLGTVKNKGFELGIDGAVNQALNVFANYSYQAEPEPDFALSEINLPPTQPLQRRLQLQPGPLPRQPVGQLRGRRVLAGRARRALRGPTEAYTQVNGAFGVKFAAATSCTTTIKVINLTRRGHPVARVRRHHQAPGDRRAAVPVLRRLRLAATGYGLNTGSMSRTSADRLVHFRSFSIAASRSAPLCLRIFSHRSPTFFTRVSNGVDREVLRLRPVVHFLPRQRRRHAGKRAAARAVGAGQRLALDVLQVVDVDRAVLAAAHHALDRRDLRMLRRDHGRDDLAEQHARFVRRARRQRDIDVQPFGA